jgi:hypothetical protein
MLAFPDERAMKYLMAAEMPRISENITAIAEFVSSRMRGCKRFTAAR